MDNIVYEVAPTVEVAVVSKSDELNAVFYECLKTNVSVTQFPFFKTSNLESHGQVYNPDDVQFSALPNPFVLPNITSHFAEFKHGAYAKRMTYSLTSSYDGLQALRAHFASMKQQNVGTVDQVEQDFREVLNSYQPPATSTYPERLPCDLAKCMKKFKPLLKVGSMQDPLKQILTDANFPIPGLSETRGYLGTRGMLSTCKQEVYSFTRCVNLYKYSAPKVYLGFYERDQARVAAFYRQFTDQKCSTPFMHDDVVLLGEALQLIRCPVVYLIQHPGEVVFTMPGAIYQTLDLGFNYADSVNMWTRNVLPLVSSLRVCYCVDRLLQYDCMHYDYIDLMFTKLELSLYKSIYWVEKDEYVGCSDAKRRKALKSMRIRWVKQHGNKVPMFGQSSRESSLSSEDADLQPDDDGQAPSGTPVPGLEASSETATGSVVCGMSSQSRDMLPVQGNQLATLSKTRNFFAPPDVRTFREPEVAVDEEERLTPLSLQDEVYISSPELGEPHAKSSGTTGFFAPPDVRTFGGQSMSVGEKQGTSSLSMLDEGAGSSTNYGNKETESSQKGTQDNQKPRAVKWYKECMLYTGVFKRKIAIVAGRLSIHQKKVEAICPGKRYSKWLSKVQRTSGEQHAAKLNQKLLKAFIDFAHGNKDLVYNRIAHGYTERLLIAHYVIYSDEAARAWFECCIEKAEIPKSFITRVLASQEEFDTEFQVNRNQRIPSEDIALYCNDDVFQVCYT